MDRKNLILITTSILILVHIIVYTKLVVYDGVDLAFYLKWIPTLLLAVQSWYFSFLPKNAYYKSPYAICLGIGYSFCMVGDIALLFPSREAYLGGVVMFLSCYLLISVSRLHRIRDYWHREFWWPCIIGITGVLLVQIVYVNFLVYILNDKDDKIFMVTMVIIYSFFINFGVSCHFVYQIVHLTRQASFSFIGILLFGISDCILVYHDIQNSGIPLEVASLVLYWSGLTILGWSVYQKQDMVVEHIY